MLISPVNSVLSVITYLIRSDNLFKILESCRVTETHEHDPQMRWIWCLQQSPSTVIMRSEVVDLATITVVDRVSSISARNSAVSKLKFNCKLNLCYFCRMIQDVYCIFNFTKFFPSNLFLLKIIIRFLYIHILKLKSWHFFKASLL